jgi:hypothetical protein
MKTKSNFFIYTLFVLFLGIALNSCAGPEGPEGPAGQDGLTEQMVPMVLTGLMVQMVLTEPMVSIVGI